MTMFGFVLLGLLCVVPAVAAAPEVAVSRGGLHNTITKLAAGEPVTVAYLGGSITEGAGASDGNKTSYRALVTQWFRDTFPQSKITEVNAAIGGTPSNLGVFRLQHDVLVKKPDLVFVEFAVNDGGSPDAEINRSMEGIVRQIWRDNPKIDILFVYTLAKENLDDFKAGKLPRTIRLHDAIADHYAIPSVDMAAVAADKINSGAMAWDAFSKDVCHPTDPGYRMFAGAVESFLLQQKQAAAGAGVQTSGAPTTTAQPSVKLQPHPFPPSMFPDNFQHASMIDFSEGKLGAGWSREDKAWVGRFDHVAVATTPGATLDIDFTGTVFGIFYVLGPDSGAFEYSIDAGDWKKCDPFDQWAKDYYRAHSRMLETGLKPGAHHLQLRPLADHSPDSKGAATRLAYLLEDGEV